MLGERGAVLPMKRSFIVFAACMMMAQATGSLFAEGDLWSRIVDTTWHADNGWAGAGVVLVPRETVGYLDPALADRYPRGTGGLVAPPAQDGFP